jgi:hypothetical protein
VSATLVPAQRLPGELAGHDEHGILHQRDQFGKSERGGDLREPAEQQALPVQADGAHLGPGELGDELVVHERARRPPQRVRGHMARQDPEIFNRDLRHGLDERGADLGLRTLGQPTQCHASSLTAPDPATCQRWGPSTSTRGVIDLLAGDQRHALMAAEREAPGTDGPALHRA